MDIEKSSKTLKPLLSKKPRPRSRTPFFETQRPVQPLFSQNLHQLQRAPITPQTRKGFSTSKSSKTQSDRNPINSNPSRLGNKQSTSQSATSHDCQHQNPDLSYDGAIATWTSAHRDPNPNSGNLADLRFTPPTN